MRVTSHIGPALGERAQRKERRPPRCDLSWPRTSHLLLFSIFSPSGRQSQDQAAPQEAHPRRPAPRGGDVPVFRGQGRGGAARVHGGRGGAQEMKAWMDGEGGLSTEGERGGGERVFFFVISQFRVCLSLNVWACVPRRAGVPGACGQQARETGRERWRFALGSRPLASHASSLRGTAHRSTRTTLPRHSHARPPVVGEPPDCGCAAPPEPGRRGRGKRRGERRICGSASLLARAVSPCRRPAPATCIPARAPPE